MVPEVMHADLVYDVIAGNPITEEEYATYKAIPQDVLEAVKKHIYKRETEKTNE